MKSRQKKHLHKLVKRSPIIAFSIEEKFTKGERLNDSEIAQFEQRTGYDLNDTYLPSYRQKKEQLVSNLYLFVDNYLNCGGHQWVYLLIPIEKGVYQIVERQKKTEWQERYWQKEDPNGERDWCYFDEDTNELFEYMIEQFMKYQK